MIDLKNINVIEYTDVLSILKMRHDIEGFDFDEDMEIICHDKYGNPEVMTVLEQMNYIVKQGIWGFVHDRDIHVWYHSGVTMEDLIYFFSHELGHLTGDCLHDPIKEEIRAEEYSRVALSSYNIAKNIKNK